MNYSMIFLIGRISDTRAIVDNRQRLQSLPSRVNTTPVSTSLHAPTCINFINSTGEKP